MRLAAAPSMQIQIRSETFAVCPFGEHSVATDGGYALSERVNAVSVCRFFRLRYVKASPASTGAEQDRDPGRGALAAGVVQQQAEGAGPAGASGTGPR